MRQTNRLLQRLSFLLTLLLVTIPAGASPPDRTVRAGKLAKVICHFEGERCADAALGVAEAAVRTTLELLGFKAADLKHPVEIHLYRTSAAYREAEARLTGGKFATNNAFSSHAERNAHVALVPDCDDAVLARLGPSRIALRQVAHEAAHLTVFAVVRSFKDHPDWLAEGIATFVEEQALKANGLTAGVMKEPFSSTRMVRARKLRLAGKLPDPAAIFAGDADSLATGDRYSVYWLFFRYLLTSPHEKKTRQLLKSARTLGGGSTYAKRLSERATRIWGRKGLTSLGEDFAQYLAHLEPEWEEVYRSLTVDDGILTQRAYASSNAIAWRTTPVRKRTCTIEGTAEILDTGSPQLNLLLGRSDAGFVTVAFRRGFGVTVLGYDSKRSAWSNLANAKHDKVRSGGPFAFEVRIKGAKVEIRIDGKTVLSADIGKRDLTGPWGLGVQAGGAGVWKNVRLKQ